MQAERFQKSAMLAIPSDLYSVPTEKSENVQLP